MSDKAKTWFFLTVAVLAVVVWAVYYSESKQACDTDNGVLVRGVWWGYECVEREQ